MTEKDTLYADKLRNKALSDYERLDHAINELERQTCDTHRNNLAETSQDCISRQEAISAIQNKYYDNTIGIDIVDIVAHLPSVTPTVESEVVI